MEDLAEVAVLCGEGGHPEADAERESAGEEIEYGDEEQEEGGDAYRAGYRKEEEGSVNCEEQNQLEDAGEEIREDDGERDDEAWEVDLAEEIGVVGEDRAAGHEVLLEIIPTELIAEVEEDGGNAVRGHPGDAAHEEGIDERSEEGIEDEPCGAEDGLLVLRGELAVDEEGEEVAIFPKLSPMEAEPGLVGLDDCLVRGERSERRGRRGRQGARARRCYFLGLHDAFSRLSALPIPVEHIGIRPAADCQGGNEIGLGGKPPNLVAMSGLRGRVGLSTSLIARPELKEFPRLFSRGPCDAEVPLGIQVEEAAGHFIEGNVLADALDVEAEGADIARDGDEGEVIALGDIDAEAGGGAGEGGDLAGVAVEDVLAEEFGPEFLFAVAGDGPAGLAGPAGFLRADAPDVKLVEGEIWGLGAGEPEGLLKVGQGAGQRTG